ncbi:MULE transposase domain [Arabidopsis thaliana x Arabidopsis arenosa]|uniref:MULE transposase domain n=1 Tax=Arabidopsis thaliana x Arabidopsis arenosa TaxID=1240361 RepID=A0A8T1Z0P6_9BRAS|nr:MULE transposase domain [Arabidopsis thaliana x Arabidopsis arenosa]
MVICGEWGCSDLQEWEFDINKILLSRIVPITDGMKLCELEEVVLKEFEVKASTLGKPRFSYLPPNIMDYTTGKKTPPILVTSEVGLKFFIEMFLRNRGLNLFVNFGEITGKRITDGENQREEYVGGLCVKKSNKRVFSSSSEGIERSDDDIGWEAPTAGSKTPKILTSQDDEAVLEEVEVLEAMYKIGDEHVISSGCEGKSRSSGSSGDFEDILEDSEEEIELGESEVEVSPTGYDTEFWGHFLDDELAGSNAPEIMCSPREFSPQVEKGFEDDSTAMPVGGQMEIQTRKLEDVDDEEFDIPPLFDDCEYERDEIPDLDIEDDEKGIFKGRVYASKQDCQISLAIHAIKEQFYFKQTITKRHSFVLTCADEKCQWRIMAHEMKTCGYYQIRKADLEHTCNIETRGQYMKKATSRVIASVYKAKYSKIAQGPVPMDLQQMVLEDLRVTATYSTCWRAREKAVEELFGTDDDSYKALEEYLYVLKLANPGTVTDIKTEAEENGCQRFLYMFLAFGASIEGFRHLRRVVVVDGTHLTGKYKGVLLTASGQDANFQVFPLAFAVVDSENDESWTWFFEKLEPIIADSSTMTIISDRNQSIYVAKKKVFPRAYHGACIVHLARNVNAKFYNKGLANLVKNAGYAYTVKQFNEIYAQISMKNSECANYLERMKTGHWTRVYFQGERYNLMTSNIAETLNNALRKGRGSPIIELLKFIRAMLTRWFSARRTKSGKHTGVVTPEVDKVLTKNLAKVRGSKVGNVHTWSYEIVGLFNGKHQVSLDRKQCTCKEYNKLKIPCGHAMLAATSIGQSYGSLVGDFYKTAAWRATYKGLINPELNLKDVVIPNGIKIADIYPPRTRRPPGRPKQLRIKSIGEFPVEIKDCQGENQQGEQMEATIDRRFAAVYVETMKEKQWKTISTFTVRKISERIRPTTNPYGIRFMDNTIVTRAEPKQTILFKNLTPFDYIVEKSVPYNILVEIVGAIVEVGGLRNTSANMVDVNGYAITFKIMDRYKVLLTCEALGQTAIDFEENYRQYGRPNMIVALGWWRVVRPNWRSKNVKIVSSGKLHMPAGLLAKIVSYLGEDGIGELKNWIVTGTEGLKAVLSPECLSTVRLDKSRDFIFWARADSVYNSIFSKCLEEKNPYALYVRSIEEAFRNFDIEEAIKIVAVVRRVFPVAELLYIMLNSCAGKEDRVVYSQFKKRYNYEEAEQLCDTLRFHIKSVNPKGCGTYCETWTFSDSPVCWESHQFFDEYNVGPYIVERCIDCIYFYLSRDIMEMS